MNSSLMTQTHLFQVLPIFRDQQKIILMRYLTQSRKHNIIQLK